VFTKYDQFLRNVGIDLEDRNYEDPSIDVSKEAKEKVTKDRFEEHFLYPLGEGVPWVRLRGGFAGRVECLDKLLVFFDSYGQARGML